MNNRIKIHELQPDALKAMMGLEGYLATTALDPTLIELVKVRASQINGCAYCIQIHTLAARELGETEQRLYALSAWKESPLFTDKERATLALTDEITLISNDGLSTKAYEAALQALGETQLAQAIMLAVTVNAWNRIAVSTLMHHE